MSNNYTTRETIKRYYRIDRREIAFLRFIFEAYDGLAIIETLDSVAGSIIIHIAPGCEPDVEMILGELKKDIFMESLTPFCQLEPDKDLNP
jgi:hypothetical protein